jgi:DNA-nicking Smr family endonuclease
LFLLLARAGHSIDLPGFGGFYAKLAGGSFRGRPRRRSPGAVVHIITGRGRGSPGRPVLRGAIRTLLKSGTIDGVGEFVPDHADGGFLVKLKT